MASEFEESWGDETQVRGAILSAPIRDLEPNAPVCVTPETAVSVAIDRMNLVKAGCVLVVDSGNRLRGILTERDILRHVAQQLDLTTPVSAAMTPDPETVRMDDGLVYALRKMNEGGYRHIPVLDDSGEPVGIVSVRDFVRFIVTLFPNEVLNVPPEPGLDIAGTAEGA